MILSNLFAAFTLLASVAAAPSSGLETLSERLNSRQDISLTEEGTHGGYFYSWWSDGASPATYVASWITFLDSSTDSDA
jgi:endo-1,4-beta-xylanase